MHVIASFLLAASVLVGTPAVPDPSPPQHPLDRIAVIGASATYGYGTYVKVPRDKYTQRELINLADVLSSTVNREHEVVLSNGNFLFFRSPERTGSRLAGKARKLEPTLLVALDYLFWYGYGSNGVDGERHTGTESRLALLEVGLKELDTFTCPIIVFDFPDMSPAVGRMLSSSQMPSTEGLEALNRRLENWAKSKPNVVVLPLAELVIEIRTDEGFQIEELTWPAGSGKDIIQNDALHPTTDGLIAMMQLAMRSLDNHTEDVGPDDYLRTPALVRQKLEAMARARGEDPVPTGNEPGTPPEAPAPEEPGEKKPG